jgi:hypothetical protein
MAADSSDLVSLKGLYDYHLMTLVNMHSLRHQVCLFNTTLMLRSSPTLLHSLSSISSAFIHLCELSKNMWKSNPSAQESNFNCANRQVALAQHNESSIAFKQ